MVQVPQNNCNSSILNLIYLERQFCFLFFTVPAEDCKMEKAWIWSCCLLALAILASESRAQDTSCLTQLVPCLNYLNSTDSRPSSNCCDPLRSVIKSNPQCLCSLVSSNTASSGTSSINVTQALLLPSRCGLNVNASSCTAASSPNTNATDSNSASKFSSVGTLLAVVIPLIVQVSCV